MSSHFKRKKLLKFRNEDINVD